MEYAVANCAVATHSLRMPRSLRHALSIGPGELVKTERCLWDREAMIEQGFNAQRKTCSTLWAKTPASWLRAEEKEQVHWILLPWTRQCLCLQGA